MAEGLAGLLTDGRLKKFPLPTSRLFHAPEILVQPGEHVVDQGGARGCDIGRRFEHNLLLVGSRSAEQFDNLVSPESRTDRQRHLGKLPPGAGGRKRCAWAVWVSRNTLNAGYLLG